MSEVQKPVEETPAAAPAAETPAQTATEAPAAEAPKENAEAPATEETTATPAVETAAEPAKAEAKEVTPASEGTLGHKGPGLVKGFRFAKRFFYFSDEPVAAKQLSAFHQNEKPAVANPIAAWASQTGKGLLFFAKRPEDKSTPTGIFNLADVSDISKDGPNEFLFKVGAHKHTFQAASAAERDSWVAAIEAKSAEAKAQKETILASEGYKAELEKLMKPAAVVIKKPAENKAAENKEETPAATEDSKAKEEQAAKSRSQSRKRMSIFGSMLGKKEEVAEEKKEEKAEDKKETTDENKAAEPAAESSAEPAPAAAAAETTETAPAEDKKEEKRAKRASIFGNLFQKVTSPSQEKTEKEATAPAEDNTVASTAPQLENPVEGAAGKPIEPESVTAPAGEASKDTAAPAEAEAATAKDKRRSFFGLGMKKEKKAETEEGADGETKDTKKKLGDIFRRPSKAVKLDNKDEATVTESEAKADKAPEAPAQETAATEETPAAAEEAPKPAENTAPAENVNVPTSTPVQAAA